MANAILCSNQLNDTALIDTLSTTTALTGYPASNLRVFQPGQSFRHAPTATNDTIGFYKEFGTVYGDTVALVGTNFTPASNMLRYSNTLDEATVWTPTNGSVGYGAAAGVAKGKDRSYRLTESGTGEHYLEQPWVPPTSAPSGTHRYSSSVTFSCYVNGSRNIRLRIYQGSNYAYQDYTGSTGAKYGAVGSSGLTATSTTEACGASVGDGNWHRVSVTVSDGLSTVVAGNIVCRIQILDGSYATSYAAGGSLDMAAPQLEIATAASAYSPTTSANAAQWRIAVYDDAGVAIVEDTKWMPVTALDRSTEDSDMGFINLFHKLTSAQLSSLIYVFYRDANNADGYVQIGTLVFGLAFQPSANIATYSLQLSEQGSVNRSLGGQVYRQQNSVSRTLMMDHQFLTEAEAVAGAFDLQRTVGRSRGVLACVEPDGTYQNNTVIWGLLEQPGEIIRRAYSTTLGGNVYSSAWEVVEALP